MVIIYLVSHIKGEGVLREVFFVHNHAGSHIYTY